INKIDKHDADPDRVRNELAKHELIPEEWGGDTMYVNVSALNGTGVDKLLEALLVQAEVLELKAPDTGPAAGVVLESSLERGRGDTDQQGQARSRRRPARGPGVRPHPRNVRRERRGDSVCGSVHAGGCARLVQHAARGRRRASRGGRAPGARSRPVPRVEQA